MHCNRPLFSPEQSSAGEYVMVVTLLNNFHKSLKERQSLCLNKVRWGKPVLPGKHANFTIDRKHRGTPNPYDTDPNAPEIGDETEIEGTPLAKMTACTNEDSNAIDHLGLDENNQRENSSPVSKETDVPVVTDEPLNQSLSLSESVLHSNEDGNIQKWKSKKLKLSNKLRNKENHKKNGKLRCLQRRSLFRKSHLEASSVFPSIPEIPEVDAKQMQTSFFSDTSSKGMTTSPDLNMSECSEDIVFPCDSPSRAAVGLVSEKSCLNDKSFSSPGTTNWENENSSPLRESNLSTPCEIRSNSPVFSAYESPFRNSDVVSHLKDYAMVMVEESSASIGSSVTNAEGKNGETPSSSSKPQPRLLESDVEDSVVDDKRKRQKTTIGKKLPRQRAMVQCPLCCDWFKPKVIEVHAANCGIMTAAPMQPDENLDVIIIPGTDNEIKREMDDLDCPSEKSKPDPTKNITSVKALDAESTMPNLKCLLLMDNESFDVVLESFNESINESVMALENETTCAPFGNQVESGFVPVQKRCFICDVSYVEGKPFSNHLRMCRKKYQKLKNQFSRLFEECEEPQRKTRSRSTPHIV